MKIATLSILILVAITVYFLDPIIYTKQKTIYDFLVQISSIVLAITGAWIAVVFPKAFKNILLHQDEYKTDFKIVEILIKIVVGSISILMIILVVKAIGLVIPYLHFDIVYIYYLQKISLFLLLSLVIYEVWILLLVIFPIQKLLRQTKKENLKNNIIDNKHRRKN